jgi:archaetidylinositol phosphate synthase
MSHNTWVHAAVRPLVRPLVRTRLSPNHLTGLRLLTAMLAAALLGTGDPDMTGWACAAFVISFLLDRADGQLARMAGKQTLSGHRFDLVADYASHVLVFAGLGIGLRDGALGSLAAILGIVAGTAIVAIFALVSRIEQIDGAGAAAFPTGAGFDADDAIVIVPVAVWLEMDAEILVAAAIGAPAFLAFTCFRFRRYLRYVVRPTVERRRASMMP